MENWKDLPTASLLLHCMCTRESNRVILLNLNLKDLIYGFGSNSTLAHFIYILDSSNSSSIVLVSSSLALEATELVSKLVTEMALELINNHLISVQQKR